MIRFLLCILLSFTLVACQDAAPTASVEVSPGGIEYRLLQLPDNDDVSIHIAWATDWAYRPDTNKAAPLVGTQLILAAGAQGYPPGDAGERFADLNSEANIYVSASDHVVGELSFERDKLDETITIANAHLRSPTFDPVWFDRIRSGAAQNMAEARANAANAGYDAVRWRVFGDQPLRNGLSLDEPGIFEELTREEAIDWYAETFTAAPEAIVVAGGIDAANAGTAIDALLAGLPEAKTDVAHNSAPTFTDSRMLLHVPEAKTTTLSFIAPLPPTRLGAETEDLILVHALGGDDQSVLFEAIRTELRATYEFGAGMANYTRDHRILALSGEVDPAKLEAVENAVREAYAAFWEKGPSGDLEKRKAPLVTSFEQLPEFIIDLARAELQSELDGYEVGRSLNLIKEANAVTQDSLMDRLSNHFPSPQGFIVIAVSPDADALPGACIITKPSEAANCP